MKLDEDMDNAAAQVAGALSTDPIDTAAREVVTTQRQAVKTSLYNALLENPDVAARAQRLGRETNLPADVVQRNFPEVERGIYLNKVDSMLQNNPAVAEFLASPAFAAVAHDDVDNLGAMETALRGFKNTGGAAMSGLWSMASGAVGLARASADITAPLLDPAVGTVLPENPLRRTAQGLANVQGFLSGQAEANMPKAQSIAGAGYFSGVASLSRNLAALPLALVNPQAALAMMVAPVAGEEYGKAREKNVAPIQSLTYGVTQGAIEYATERLPLLKLVGDLKVGAPLYQVVANQLATEIPGEQLATILQDLNEWGTLNPDKPFADYLKERPSAAAQTLIATVVGVGGQVSVVKGIEALVSMNQPRTVEQGGPAAAGSAVAQTIMENALQMRMKAAQVEMTERDAQALTQLVDLVQASKLAARDPATFEQFVQSVAQNGPVQDVYISAQIFAQAAQEAGVTEQQLPPAVREQLAEALATGGDIRIPIEQFAAQIATTQYAQGLIDHMKTDPMGMSRAEAQVFMQTQVDEMQAQVERTLAEREADVDFRTSIDAVRSSFKAQLDTANRFTSEVNDSYANMLANFYAVTAAKAGMAPEELMRQYPLGIQAEGATGASVMMDQGPEPDATVRDTHLGKTYTAPNGATISVQENSRYSPRPNSITDFVVPDGIRGQGVGGKLLTQILRRYNPASISAAASSQPAVALFYKNGFRPLAEPDATLDRSFEILQEWSSVTMVIPEPDAAQQFAQSPLPDTIDIDGVQRPTTNSNGQPIAQTEEGVRNFWAWFGDSKVVDDQGRPLVYYRMTDSDRTEFRKSWRGGLIYFAATPEGAEVATRAGSGATYPVYLRAEKIRGQGGPGVFYADAEAKDYEQKLIKGGFDAVKVRDEASRRGGTLAVLNPTQIKSAIGNTGAFDPANPNILNQGEAERDLIVTHNLTAGNLLHAEKMGGIPVPSLAVTRKDTPLAGFGEITLIGAKELVDPKGYANTKVFGADIYSPRYPSVERELDRAAVKNLMGQLQPMADQMGLGLPEWQDLEREGQRELERSLPVMGQFLREQGIEPTLVYRPGMRPEREARLEQFGMGEFLNVTSKFQLEDNPAFVKAALAEKIDQYEALGDRRSGLVESLKNDPDAQRRFVRETASEVAEAAKLKLKPEVDRYDTLKAMEAQVAEGELGGDFQQYVRDLLDSITKSERIFQGFTYSGNRRYIPHTLDNVVKLLKKELRGGENFNYGVGSLRAKFTPQFKSVAQIKANKDRLVSAAEFESVKKEIDAEFFALAEAINPNLRIDTVVAILEDAATKGIVRAAQGYGETLTPEAAQQANEFLSKLRTLPTAYFEAKILREVDLGEFSGAVVPEGVDPKAIEALQRRGVKNIKTYKAGDEADRAAKIAEFDDLFFQGNRGQIAFGDDITKVPSIITLLKGADLSTFLHESGHFFLEVQMDLAARISAKGATATPGEQALVADAQTLLDWFGVRTIDEWFAMPMEQKRSYHERFARGFEAYLFEGKAPSIELQGLFQRFRAWLLRIYKDMKALRVELTDDVRGVMDRMLATTEQIELAEKGRSMLPLFASAQQAGMTTDEFGAYQELGTQATQDAIQDLQARTLRDMQWISNARGREIKKLQREAASRRAEVRIEARREIMSQPVYQAWQFLTNKLNADDKAAVQARPPRTSTPGKVDETIDSLFTAIAKLGGLQRDQIESTWNWDSAERSPMPVFGKYVLRREGGLTIDEMGESLVEYGYLKADTNGKFDLQQFEELFDREARGTPQFSTAKDYSDFGPEPMAGESVDFENIGAGRLDLGSLRTMPLPEEIVQIMENLKMASREGIHPDLVAESFGFTSGDELVRTLAIAEAPNVAIEGLTDQKMLERYGDLATPEAIQRAADAAIHNDARARFVATELNALQKATGKPKVLASAAREYAKAMIDRLQVRNVKPNQYAAAEVRAAKAAEKAMKAGDTATAAAEKRNQLINTYATKSAHDAITEVEKGVRYLKKFQSEGVRKKLDVDYLDQIDAILERFDLRAGQSLKSVDKRKALAKWIGEQEELGIEVELPEKVMSEAFRQSYKDLTVEEFRGLIDSIKQIEHLGRLKEKLLTAKDNKRFAEVVQGMVDSITLHAGGRRANNRTRDALGNRALNLFKGFMASHRKVASLSRELDGFNDAGPVWTYIIKSMNESGDREASMRADATRRLTELLKPVMAAGRMGGKGQYFASIGESLNRGEQLVLALNVGNAGNLQRLLDGRGWTDQQIVPVLQNLTAADWQFVQSVWDFFESYRPEIAAKERRVMGKEPDWVQPQAFTVMTRDGQELAVRGGYFPIVYDARESGRAERQADAEQAKQMMKGAFVAATTRRSFTKTRAEAVTGRPLVLTWDALFRGVNDVIHDLTWHEWVIDANRIMRNDKVDKAIRTTYGADVVQQFKAAIRDIAAGDAPNLDALSKVLTPLRTGAAVAGLGFNLMNAMIQPLGLTQSMVRIGAKWVGLGIAEWAKSPVGLVRNIHERSEFMRNRARTMQRELNEIQSVVQGKGEIRQKIDAVMFVPMQSLQLIADVPTWWGAYQKALAEAPADLAQDAVEDRAVRLADQAVIDAQAGGQVKDLALIQRGGPLQKLFTVFYGYFSASYNLGVEKAKATNFRKPLDVMHLAWDFLLLYSVPAVLASLLKDVLQPGDDDGDDEELARKLIGEQISYLMGTMVGLREITGAVQFATGTRQFNMGYGGPAGLRFFQELDKLGQQIGQGELDRALVRSTVNVGGVMLHLPSSQINRTIDGVIAISEGRSDNPAALLFGPAPEAR